MVFMIFMILKETFLLEGIMFKYEKVERLLRDERKDG